MRKWMLCATMLVALVFGAGLALGQTPRPAGWSEESHGNDVPPDYAVVLPDDRVNELTIVFRAADWTAALANMTEIYGEHGVATEGMRFIFNLLGGGPADTAGGPCAGGFELEFGLVLIEEHGVEQQTLLAAESLAEEYPAAFAEMIGIGPGTLGQVFFEVMQRCAGNPEGFPGGDLRDRPDQFEDPFNITNPDWFPVEIRFAGQVWPEVGFRFKGNSSLAFGWGEGRFDLPIKLDFDEFEDQHPELRNQRFFGFKQLTLANNFADPSLLREKVTADIFRAAGVPAAETAWYLVHLDRGDGAGAQLLGLYTAVELPDDTLIETQFADDNGNMYKPDGPGASFAAGSFDEDSFDKETNGDSDYGDVLALFAALHADTRHDDPAAWRAGLESVFYVDGFLRWLATNQLLQHWDAYGSIPHNYYLYADEARGGALTWIPWDHNLALRASLTGIPAAPGGFGVALGIGLDEVGPGWPLIRFLLDDAVYGARYRELVAEAAAGAFSVARMTEILAADVALLTPALQEAGLEDALAGLGAGHAELLTHVQDRAAAAAEYLAQDG